MANDVVRGRVDGQGKKVLQVVLIRCVGEDKRKKKVLYDRGGCLA